MRFDATANVNLAAFRVVAPGLKGHSDPFERIARRNAGRDRFPSGLSLA
jgi:hypothetical protein